MKSPKVILAIVAVIAVVGFGAYTLSQNFSTSGSNVIEKAIDDNKMIIRTSKLFITSPLFTKQFKRLKYLNVYSINLERGTSFHLGKLLNKRTMFSSPGSVLFIRLYSIQ